MFSLDEKINNILMFQKPYRTFNIKINKILEYSVPITSKKF